MTPVLPLRSVVDNLETSISKKHRYKNWQSSYLIRVLNT